LSLAISGRVGLYVPLGDFTSAYFAVLIVWFAGSAHMKKKDDILLNSFLFSK